MAEKEKAPCDADKQSKEPTNNPSTLYQSALDLAERGLPVFPLADRSKKTRKGSGGFKDATCDAEQVRTWWTKTPNANIGIATDFDKDSGRGLLVVDIDVGHGSGDVDGSTTLREFEATHGALAPTVTVNTPNNGTHYYYTIDKLTKNVNRCADVGVDIKCNGYVVAPPSVLDIGQYVYETSFDDIEIAPVDDTVRAFIDYVRGDSDSNDSNDKTNDAQQDSGFVLPDVIPEGKRNDTLFKYAASLHAKGTPDDVIYTSVSDANIARCKPPLSPEEARGRARSAIERYEKGKSKNAGKDASKVGNITKIEQLFADTSYLRDALATNTFDNRLYIRNVVPWSHETNRLYDKELDFAHIRKIVLDDIGRVDKESITNAISITGNKTHFDSVLDALALLPEWDGKEHVGHLFNKILGAKDIQYTREVETILFNGLVMRQYHPGCKFDYIPVLIGAQDLGKSLFCESLALNPEWFTDTPIDPRDREVGRYVRGRIVVEIPELSGFKGKDVESIKAFITRRYDDFRKLYVDDVVKHPRRYVIIGTTNEDQFLRDRTGNRRFLPIYCGVCEITTPIEGTEAVTYEIQQAWAETLHKYNEAGGKLPLVLPKDARVTAKKIQELAMQDDPRIGKIGAWLKTKAESAADKRTCAVQIICDCLGFEENKYPAYLPTEIHTIMKNHFPEWRYSTQRVTIGDFGQQRHYKYTPPEQPEQ